MVYHLVKVFAAFVRILPLPVALALGRGIAMLIYWGYPRRRRQVIRNIKIGMSGRLTYEEINRLARRVFTNYGQNIIELLRLPRMRRQDFAKYVNVEGAEYLKAALDKGRGVVMLGMHLGNWELGSLISWTVDRPYSVVKKKQRRQPRLDALLQEYRSSIGAKVIDRDGMGLRRILHCLKNNEMVAMLADQGGMDGQVYDFLNTRSSFPVGPVRLALQQDVPVCFAYIYRRCGGYHNIVVSAPFEFHQTGHIESDTLTAMPQVVRRMEAVVQEHPDEYLWFYKYWKHGARRTIVILYDEKTGHLRQAQAVAKILQDKLEARGLTVPVHEIRIDYRSRFRETAAALQARLRWRTLGPGDAVFLRGALTETSFRTLTAVTANYVVSAGSHLAWLNAVMARDQGACAINLLKPGLMPDEAFHLNFLPRHDVPEGRPPKENTVVTKGAPNLITPDGLQAQAAALVKRYSHLRNPSRVRLGVLLGGETARHEMPSRLVRMVLHQLQAVTTEFSAEILLTTSRRTPPEVESMVQRELKKDRGCALLIVANQQNVPEAVGGILGLSDVVIVSGDSISMICEAAASGKPVVVFPVPGRDGQASPDKHRRFIDGLHEDGHIYCAPPQGIKDAVLSCVKQKFVNKPLDDRATISAALERVL